MTAGHCLYDPGSHTEATFLEFYAQYPNTFYGFVAAKPGWFLQWQNNTDYDYDIGLIRMSSSMKAIGNLGLMVGDFAFASCCSYATGYPAEPPFPASGQTLYQAYGTNAGHDDAPYSNTNGMNGNNMTFGASGGPWFSVAAYIYPPTPPIAYPQGAWMVGLNSYGFNGTAPPEFSPEFRFPIADLWYCVNKSGPGC